MFRFFMRLLLAVKWPVLFLIAGLTAYLGSRILGIQIDPSVDGLFQKNSEEYRYYREYRGKFGSDQMICVAVDTLEVFDRDSLRRIAELTEKIRAYPQVERVLSLTNAGDIRHKRFGVREVPLLEDFLNGAETAGDLKRRVLASELYVNNLVSITGKVAGILVYLKPQGRDRESGGRFIRELSRLLKNCERHGMRCVMAGSPVEQYEFIRLIRRDQLVFIPLISLLLVGTLWLIYRSVLCMLLAMGIVGTALVWILGTISLLKGEMNLVTSLLAPVIMIITVVNAIHVMNLFLEIRYHHSSVTESVLLTMEQLAVPLFLTHFTTVLGFVSLAVTKVPAIQSFGIYAALGTIYSYLAVCLLPPALLPLLPYRRSRAAGGPDAQFFNRLLAGFLEELDYRWKWFILAFTIAILAASVLGVRRLQVDTNIIKQMKPESELAQATRFIDDNLTGVYSLGFVFRRKDGGTFEDGPSLEKVDRFKQFLEAMSEITKANGITPVLKKIHEARENRPEGYRIPRDAKTLRRYFKGMADSGSPELWNYISRDFSELRLEARMKAVGTLEGAEVEERARRYLKEHLEKDFEWHMTGDVVLLGRMARDLVHNQSQSFGWAFLSIFTVIVIFFRSLRMGLLAAIPNLLPVLAVYGLMGFAGIELSLPTAMISSIVLGLVVDASIHFLHRFRAEFDQRRQYLQALHHTYRHVGQSLTLAAVILSVGFSSSVLASFKPTVYFGVLTGVTIIFALICTLVLLPVCLIFLKPFGPNRLFSK